MKNVFWIIIKTIFIYKNNVCEIEIIPKCEKWIKFAVKNKKRPTQNTMIFMLY